MGENKLSVWSFSCAKRYYLTHPWRWLHDFYRNLKNFIHRGRYGFAYYDVWELGQWLPRVASRAIKYLAENGHGYPGTEPWATPEEWHDYLIKLSDELEWCADSQDEIENEYQEQMDEITKRCHREKVDENGMFHTWLELEPKDKIIRNKYFERMEEIVEANELKRAKIFTELGKVLERLLD